MGNTTIFESRICRVSLISSQFVSFHFKGNSDHKIEEFEEIISATVEFMNHKPFVVINNLSGNLGHFSKEIREFLGSHPDLIKYKYAEALIVSNLGIRLQVNFFLNFNVSKMKYKVFRSEEKAMNWILERKDEITET